MKRIVVRDLNGGVGKSISAVLFYVRSAIKVLYFLLIDFDLQRKYAFASNQLNIYVNNACNILKGEPVNYSKLAIETNFSYHIVSAVPSSLGSSDWEHETSMGEHNFSLLFSRDMDLNRFDYVFIDTARDKSHLGCSVLYVVDSVSIQVKPSTALTIIPISTSVEKNSLEKYPVVSAFTDEKISLRCGELFNETYGEAA